MKNVFMAAVLWIWLSPALSQAAPVVYPAKEVTGFSSAAFAAKAPAFAKWLDEVGIPQLSAGFVAAFKKEFGPVAVDTIQPATKHRTMVASLQLVRASQYSVPKKVSHCTEYQLPLTLSLVFTNPMSGEVLYSFTETSYAPVEVSDAESSTECDVHLKSATSANYQRLLQTLIRKARAGYNPAEIDAAVVKIWKGLYILNKGSKSGIALNDELIDAQGNSITAAYVAEDYAVATALLANEVKTGQVFSKFADQSLVKTVKKPRVLSMHRGWGDPQLEAIAGFFDSELSRESAFTLLPVNESFSAVLQAVARDTSIGQFETTNRRALPNYLIKYSYAAPRVYEIGEEGKFGYRVYEQYILGELLDKQGRIIYSAVGGDRIEDKDVGGVVFGSEARLEILLKNATVQLAEKFSRDLRFSRSVLPVESVSGNALVVKDEARQLQPGNVLLVFRKIGQVDGISGEVMVPIWQAKVTEVAGGSVTASLLMPQANELKYTEVGRDDVVIVEAISAGIASDSSTSVSYCRGIEAQAGALPFDDFPVLSRGFGYLLPYPLYDNDPTFLGKVNEALKAGGFRETLKLSGVDTGGRCVVPVHKAGLSRRQCENGECEAELQLAVGYRLYVGKEKKGNAGSQVKVSLRQVREDAIGAVIQGEMSRNSLELLKNNAVKVRYQ